MVMQVLPGWTTLDSFDSFSKHSYYIPHDLSPQPYQPGLTHCL